MSQGQQEEGAGKQTSVSSERQQMIPKIPHFACRLSSRKLQVNFAHIASAMHCVLFTAVLFRLAGNSARAVVSAAARVSH